MTPGTPQHGASGSELSRPTAASTNAPHTETQQQCRQQLIHRDTANAATENMTQDALFKMVLEARSCEN